MIGGKLHLDFGKYNIEISNDKRFRLNRTEKKTFLAKMLSFFSRNNFKYDFVYHDKDAPNYWCSQHAIKVFRDGQLYKSAIVCAIAGGTTIHSASAVIEGNDTFVCCANKVFSLSLPDLALKWVKQMDMATCFGIYKADNGLFIHGEMTITRFDTNGEIIWERGLRDVIVNIDNDREQQNDFELRDNYISLLDFSGNKYQLGFDGNFIGEQLSERQKRWDLWDKKRNNKT